MKIGLIPVNIGVPRIDPMLCDRLAAEAPLRQARAGARRDVFRGHQLPNA